MTGNNRRTFANAESDGEGKPFSRASAVALSKSRNASRSSEGGPSAVSVEADLSAPSRAAMHLDTHVKAKMAQCNAQSYIGNIYLECHLTRISHQVQRPDPGCRRGFRDDRRSGTPARWVNHAPFPERKTNFRGCGQLRCRTAASANIPVPWPRLSGGGPGTANGATSAPTQPPAGSPGPGRTVPSQVEENESGTLRTEMQTATLRNFARPGSCRPRCWRGRVSETPLLLAKVAK